jgi:TetR/AcrR family transcriptional regulator
VRPAIFQNWPLSTSNEVIQPGNDLLRRVLQRGVDTGEFEPMDLRYGVYVVLAPMLFLAMWKHSLGACSAAGMEIDPDHYITVQVNTILRGLAKRPDVKSTTSECVTP